jgi:hypothetical protein
MTARHLSVREKWLAIIVTTVLFLFANVYLIDLFRQHRTRLQAGIAAHSKQVRILRNLNAELAASAQHAAWIQATQPRLDNADTASVQLLDEVKEKARRHGVLLENPAIRPPEHQPEYTAISVEVETKSSWKPLISFQYDLQNPAQFIAVESANLKIDATDPARMHGRFKISRWFAPAALRPSPGP